MSGVNLSETDQRVLSMAWHCFTEMPKVDYKKLAEMGGYKTPASATTAYHNARKKVLKVSAAGTGSDTAAPTATTPKSTGKKRGASDTPGEGTATKKRGRKSRAETQAVATTENDAAADESKVKSEADGDDAAEQVLNGAQEFLDAKVEENAESADDA